MLSLSCVVRNNYRLHCMLMDEQYCLKYDKLFWVPWVSYNSMWKLDQNSFCWIFTISLSCTHFPLENLWKMPHSLPKGAKYGVCLYSSMSNQQCSTDAMAVLCQYHVLFYWCHGCAVALSCYVHSLQFITVGWEWNNQIKSNLSWN